MNVSYEQFIAGSLLLLKEVDKLDLSLLEEKLKEFNIYIPENRQINDKFLLLMHSKENGSFSMSNNDELLSTRSFTLEESKNDYLYFKAGDELINAMSNIDLMGFIIKKVNSYVGIREKEIDSFFGIEEKGQIKSALLSNQLYYSYEDDFIYDKERYLSIGKKGHTTLFIYDNEKAVNEFFTSLELNGYDPSILFDYFDTTESLNDKDVSSVLSIPSIEKFANDYDRYIYLPGDEAEGSISYYPQMVKK